MSYLNRVDSKESAIAFLESLAEYGLLFHPEESAFESLQHTGIGYAFLVQIERNMQRTHNYLEDPCDYALSLLESQNVLA